MSNYVLNTDKYFITTIDNKTIDIRDLQLEVLSVMDEIQRVCEKNDIKCFLIAGSSLGSCNYGGFIPWDDDMDISVSIDDWDRFVQAMKNDLNDNFYFDSFETDKKFNTINGPWMKVRKKGTYIEEVNTLLKNKCSSGNGIFVDVIPYGGISENKFIDELERTWVKFIMLFIVLFDNLHLGSYFLRKHVYKFSRRCLKRHKNSRLVSQPVSVPWEKFMHEPVFLKEDVFPLKKYEFEGREFYSYNNIEKIMVQWYGKNCLKKLENGVWVDPFPKEKRVAKHTKYLNLHGDERD